MALRQVPGKRGYRQLEVLAATFPISRLSGT